MRQRLQRAFWSLYGRHVLDNERATWREVQVGHFVSILTARCTQQNEKVLDAGCGTGDYAIALAQVGFCVTGIDYAPGMLARAQAKVSGALNHVVTFQSMDLDNRLAFADASFDHILNISVLQNTTDPLFVLGEFWRVLRPGGTLLLLHVPKSQSQSMPLRDAIRYKVAHLGKKTLGRVVLASLKVTVEHTSFGKHWTAPELRTMLQASRFSIASLDCGPPIVIIAEKR